MAGGADLRPERSELLSLRERLGALRLLRLGLAIVALTGWALLAGSPRAFASAALIPTVTYVGLAAVPDLLQRLGRPRLGPIGVALLLDAVFLAWAAHATGGPESPLGFLALAHIAAITLIGSYRTGLKLAAWYSLLLVVGSYAHASGILTVASAPAPAAPGDPGFATTAVLAIAALWVTVFVVGAVGAASERELRRQNVDLAAMAGAVAAIEAASAEQIPGVLLSRLVGLYGFTRGAVLASPDGELRLLAVHGPASPDPPEPGSDASMERAWLERRPILLARPDPGEDPRVAAMLPGGTNILIVPLFLDGGGRLGILLLEADRYRGGIRRWVVNVIQQFAAHAALSLHNAWLLEELRARLEENEALRRQLVEQNLELEVRVAERTAELRERLDDLRRVDDLRRRLVARLVEVSEAERRELAGDIHDDPIQKLVAVNMRLQLLRRALSEPAHREAVDELLGVVKVSIGSLRNLLFELRPSVLDEDGLAPALVQCLDRWGEGIELAIDNRLPREPPGETRVICYRIAQEALANVRKHAEASRVVVLLAERDRGFFVRIKDDGRGFDPADGTSDGVPGHLGLASMRERAELAGGWCRVFSLAGGGTTVEFWLPEQAAAAPAPPMDDPEDGEGSRARASRPMAAWPRTVNENETPVGSTGNIPPL